MITKVRCGRLTIDEHGIVRSVHLSHGGGIRNCNLSHIDAGFDEIHDSLRELFAINDTNCVSKLHDFQRQILDTNRYRSFLEYFNKNGLKFNATLLYLATYHPQLDNTVSPEPRRITTTTSNSRPKIPLVEVAAPSSSIVPKREIEPRHHQQTSVVDSTSGSGRRLSSTSFANYSFEKSLNELIDYLRDKVVQCNHENLLIQLFENLCTIRGFAAISLDRLKQKSQAVDERQRHFYDDILDKIEKLLRSTKALIELNKIKISHVDQRSFIKDAFTQFHKYFTTLYERWTAESNNRSSSTVHLIDSTPSINGTSASSSRKQPPTASTSRNCSTNLSEKSITASRKPCSTNHNHKEAQSLSSSRYPSEGMTRKQARPRSTSRVSIDESKNDRYALFKPLLQSLDHLSDVLSQLRFTSFQNLVKSLIYAVESCRSKIKLSEQQSLCDTELAINSMERRLANRIHDEYHRVSPRGVGRELENAFNKVLEAIGHLLSALRRYQSQLQKNKRPRKTRWSSPNPSPPVRHEPVDVKPTILQLPVKDEPFDDEESSDTSHSSLGDDVLMKVAKDAYEKRFARRK